MAFDSPTRSRLAKLVSDVRTTLTAEFSEQCQQVFGISVSGSQTTLEDLGHLDDAERSTAALLRERISYLALNRPNGDAADAVTQLLREQAFTVLNRFAALRMAEKRGLVAEAVGKGYQSKGFKVFETVARTGLGDTYDRYRQYLSRLFDELALDLGVLFDRRSPQGMLFPREPALLTCLELLNAADVEGLWAEDETIGWVYQYYNVPAERKRMRDESSAPRNSRELAVRNQFFTPRYVVEFLTDNTLGRIWYEATKGKTRLKERCRYLVRRANEKFLNRGEIAPTQPRRDTAADGELLEQLDCIPHRPLKDPRTILMIDPACGSMHFGLYAFDLFEEIYEEAWEIEQTVGSDALVRPIGMRSLHDTYGAKDGFIKDVPRLIVQHNIHGIDIDPRCAQIAGLSLWLRAQKTWKQNGLTPAERPTIDRSNIVCAEPMPGDKGLLREFVEREFPVPERSFFLRLMEGIFDQMQLAGEAGSLLRIEENIRGAIADAKNLWKEAPALQQSKLFAELEVIRQGTLAFDLSGITDEQFWDTAESRIYAALRDYAEQAEAGGGFRRRLFAEDASRGFAFIDVCRKRYDVALMNPPFGNFSKLWKDEAVEAYPNSYNDILGAFVDSFLNRLHRHGRLGAITSRTCFFLTSFKDWREKVVLTEAALTAVADLGQGVMDNAMVEAAAYVLERKIPEATIPFIRAINERDREAVIDACVAAYRKGRGEERLLLARQETFKKLPDAPFVYWVSAEDLEKFGHRRQFEPEIGEVRQGLATGDDSRFCRAVWEVAPQDTQFVYYPTDGQAFCRFDDPIVQAFYLRQHEGRPIWAFHVKAGASQPWYSPVTLKINWSNDGAELRHFTDARGKLRSRPQNVQYFYRPGFSWTQRAVRFYPYIVPAGCIPSVSRYMAFPTQGREFESLGVCSSRVVSAFLRFYAEFWQRPKYLVETLKSLPWPSIDSDAQAVFREQALREVNRRRAAYRNHEPFQEFLVPSRIFDFSEDGAALSFDATSLLGEQGEALVERAYGFDSEAARRVERDLVEAVEFQESGGASDSEEDGDDEDSDFVLDFSEEAQTSAVLSYCVGCALGRWDIRYATREKSAPELPDPFAPLPVCPPGQLQNGQGLPVRKADVPTAYPVGIPWDGILADDTTHPLDLERRVREVFAIIWKDGAETIEQDATKALGVKTLSDYFRKPAGFFSDHLKRYSKSRRQAPIYWPLSTSSGRYTLWVYYHRLTDQTLHTALADFVDPKIRDTERSLSEARLAGRQKEVEERAALLDELREFRTDLEGVIRLPWKPNLNDGVLITASPLWRLFRLPKWQKDLKACWQKLQNGDYDWAHLALGIWPDRVKAACATDKSLAIAHGLEHLYKEPANVQKAPRGNRGRRVGTSL